MATTYPFVNRLNNKIPGISSDPTPIFNSLKVCRIDSIRCTNTTKYDISVTITVLDEVDGNPRYCQFSYQEFIGPYKTLDMLEGARGRLAYPLPGETFLASTDSPIKTFDCIVYYLEYLLPNQ